MERRRNSFRVGEKEKKEEEETVKMREKREMFPGNIQNGQK